jgi:hypothetical protein
MSIVNKPSAGMLSAAAAVIKSPRRTMAEKGFLLDSKK